MVIYNEVPLKLTSKLEAHVNWTDLLFRVKITLHREPLKLTNILILKCIFPLKRGYIIHQYVLKECLNIMHLQKKFLRVYVGVARCLFDQSQKFVEQTVSTDFDGLQLNLISMIITKCKHSWRSPTLHFSMLTVYRDMYCGSVVVVGLFNHH